MRVALLTTFAASRKEPLAAMMDRVHKGFVDAGLEPFLRFNFADGGVVSFSCVDRVLKGHPELDRFVTMAPPLPGLTAVRRLSNGPLSEGANEAVPYATLQTIAAGVPRSYPFHSVALHWHSPEFGELTPVPAAVSAQLLAGILIGDSWWVNGRQRSLRACRLAEVEAGAKKLPEPSGPLATVLAACGKARKTVQAPLPDATGPGPVPAVRLPSGVAIPSANPEAVVAVKAVTNKYRDSMAEIVARANLPHDLPAPAEMLRLATGVHAGPKKPALERVFRPMGYTVSGGSGGETGTFHVRRRTAANSTVELALDCGTWSHKLLAVFAVLGLGYKAALIVPPTQAAVSGGQYQSGVRGPVYVARRAVPRYARAFDFNGDVRGRAAAFAGRG